MDTLFYDRLKTYLGSEFETFKELLKKEPIKTIFFNTNKASEEKIKTLIDFKIEKSALNNMVYYYEHDNIGKTMAYDLGLIYPQELSATMPAKVLSPKKGSLVIDMCAAPGGKSIDLLNILADTGTLISNEHDFKRAKVLLSNLERLGLSAMITSLSCDDLAKEFKDQADYVLLDAPCSGEGMIRKDPSILKNYSLNNINKLSKLQSELLDKALDLLKDGGYLVYSTCTYAIEENEMNVLEFLKRHEGVTLLDTTIDHCHRGLKYKYLESAKLLRFSPLDHTEGQFVALMKVKKDGDKKISYMKETRHKLVENFVYENLGLNKYYLYLYHDYYYLSLSPLPSISKGLLRPGIEVGTIKKGIFYPSHSLYRANSLRPYFKKVIDLSLDEYLKYRQGLSLFKDVSDGFYLLTYQDLSLGFSKASKGELKNKYPKGLRF